MIFILEKKARMYSKIKIVRVHFIKLYLTKISSNKSPQVTESKQNKYSYPFGLGTYLLTGCFQYIGSNNNKKPINADYDYEDNSSRKKRSDTSKNSTVTNMKSFCNRYAKIEKTLGCKVIQTDD